MNARVVSKVCGTLLLFSVAACEVAAGGRGTYSTLAYNKESGDLNGIEVTLIPAYGDLIASVQIAVDGLNEVHLARVRERAGVLLFSPQLDDGTTVNFSMRCSSKSCIGEYTRARELTNVKFNLTLPKSNGYWNRGK